MHLCTWTRRDRIKLTANKHLFFYLTAVTKIRSCLYSCASVNESWLHMWIRKWTFALWKGLFMSQKNSQQGSINKWLVPLKWFFCSSQLIKFKHIIESPPLYFWANYILLSIYEAKYICFQENRYYIEAKIILLYQMVYWKNPLTLKTFAGILRSMKINFYVCISFSSPGN